MIQRARAIRRCANGWRMLWRDGLGGDCTRGHVAAGPDVKAIRPKTRLSQAKFADKLRVPVGTVRDWEQYRRSPDAPARTLLGMVDADPKAALALIERMG